MRFTLTYRHSACPASVRGIYLILRGEKRRGKVVVGIGADLAARLGLGHVDVVAAGDGHEKGVRDLPLRGDEKERED